MSAMSQEEIDQMMSSGEVEEEEKESKGKDQETEEEAKSVDEPEFPEIDEKGDDDTETSSSEPKLEMLYDLQLPVSIELGRTNMLIRNILRLGRGSVIEFDKLVSEPVDVLVNGKKVAEGEVVVIDKHFGIRITTLVDPADRLRTANR